MVLGSESTDVQTTLRMKNKKAFALAALFFAAQAVHAQSEILTPPASLVLDGVPPISAEAAAKLAPYGDFRAHNMLSWHPTRREMLVRRRLTATNQVHLVTEPGVTPVPLTDFPDAVAGATFQPVTGEYFLFARAQGGPKASAPRRSTGRARAIASSTPRSRSIATTPTARCAPPCT